MEPPRENIVVTAGNSGSFRTLVKAIAAAGLVDALSAEGSFTVFAPTDAAFAKLPPGTLESLLEPRNKAQLTALLQYHVVPGRLGSRELAVTDGVRSLEGRPVPLEFRNGVLLIGKAGIVTSDIITSNGVIHAIDTVLTPATPRPGVTLSRGPAARRLVRLAIERGVPLYNDGNHAACAAVYEVACAGLLAMGEETVPDALRSELERAVASTEQPSDRAWTLRRALDRSLEALR